jgi:hypothetical protein
MGGAIVVIALVLMGMSGIAVRRLRHRGTTPLDEPAGKVEGDRPPFDPRF